MGVGAPGFEGCMGIGRRKAGRGRNLGEAVAGGGAAADGGGTAFGDEPREEAGRGRGRDAAERFDVVVTLNMYGDLLSDLTAGLIGGLGLLPSANLGTDYAMFEAVHGSAPDIAGKGIANPIAFLWSACMLLEHIGEDEIAGRIRRAVDAVLADKTCTTPDIGGTATTKQCTQAIIARLSD